MKLRFRAPEFLKKKTSEVVSDTVSADIGGDFRLKINDAEIGMRDKKAYFQLNIEGDIDRADFMKLIKMAMQGSF